MAVVHSEREPAGPLAQPLLEQPFAPTADPSYFYATRDHKACLFRVWDSIDTQSGIAVVLGSFGTGKTTLLRKVMSGMAADPNRYNTAVIGSPIPSWTSFALLEAIVRQFGLNLGSPQGPGQRSFAEYMEVFNQYLLANRNRVSTLIIDDAQNLNKRGQLELLRLAQNLETPQQKLLNLVFFGQLEWKRVLAAAPNFAQRINLVYTLQPLDLDETEQFIRFRLDRAGIGPLEGPQFSANAIEMIHAYSEGNPRVIVTICRNAMLLAGRLKTTAIDSKVIHHTIEKTMLDDPDKKSRALGVMQSAGAMHAVSEFRSPNVFGAASPASAPIVQRPRIIRESPFVVDTGNARRGSASSARANDLLRRAATNRRPNQNPVPKFPFGNEE